MQRVHSNSSLKENHSAAAGLSHPGGGVGTLEPERSPVVEVSAAATSAAHTLPPPLISKRTSSFTTLFVGTEDTGRKVKRRRAEWWCELQRIGILIVLFSLMAWVTYLFLTKDE